jgi:hypothetical protein
MGRGPLPRAGAVEALRSKDDGSVDNGWPIADADLALGGCKNVFGTGASGSSMGSALIGATSLWTRGANSLANEEPLDTFAELFCDVEELRLFAASGMFS